MGSLDCMYKSEEHCHVWTALCDQARFASRRLQYEEMTLPTRLVVGDLLCPGTEVRLEHRDGIQTWCSRFVHFTISGLATHPNFQTKPDIPLTPRFRSFDMAV